MSMVCEVLLYVSFAVIHSIRITTKPDGRHEWSKGWRLGFEV